MTLTEFLLARIAEDKAVARSIDADPYGVFKLHGGRRLQWVAMGFDRPWQSGRDRILAECDAKRAIVGTGEFATHAMKCVAAVYADHPDYQGEWAP